MAVAAGPEIEAIRHGNLPSSEQVGRLATTLVEFAERHDKLTTYGNESRGDSRKHIVKPTQRFEAPSLDVPDVYLLQQTTSAHLEDNLDGIRRLRIFDSVVRKELAIPGGRGIRSVYDFTWTDHQVTDARRRVVALPHQANPEPMIEIVDRMVTTGRSPFRDTDATAMYMVSEMDRQTADDTALLTEGIDGLIEEIDSGQRPYFEPDHEHAGFIVRH